jgi:hypothetical protein
MSVEIRRYKLRVWGPPVITCLAVLLVAAGVDLEQNWARLRSMPREARAKLAENLKKFDLVLKPDQQKALRTLDRRIFDLPQAQQAEYLAAMKRFHTWLAKLPDNRRDEVLEKAPAERMTLVRKLAAQYPVPRADTPRFLKIADPGEFSPFELAAIFAIWRDLTPAQRQGVERVPLGPNRFDELFKQGDAKKLPREITPADFDEQHWITEFDSQWKKARALLPLDELKKKQQPRWAQIIRRQAINLYFLKNAPARVTSDRLAQFVASFPAWIQSTFEPYPPDEAQRRLAIVYRLVFPPGTEIKTAPPSGLAPSGIGKLKDAPATRPPGAPAARPSRPTAPF